MVIKMKQQKESKAVVDALSYTKQAGTKALLVLGIILGACLFVSPLFYSGPGIWGIALPAAGLALLVVSIVLMRRIKKKAAVSDEEAAQGVGETVLGGGETVLGGGETAQRGVEAAQGGGETAKSEKTPPSRYKWMTYIFSILAMLAALATAAHPEGVSLRFFDGPNDSIIVKVSYYDLLSVGYANPLPMLTVILSGVATPLAIICVIGRLRLKRLQNAVFTLTIIAFAFAMLVTILPVIFAAMPPSVQNVAVSASLLVSLAAQAVSNGGS
jgi:hypothetical protein